jgi:hypothetical protein
VEEEMGFWRRIFGKDSPQSELSEAVAEAENDIRESWLFFLNKMKFKDDVLLADQLEAFTYPTKVLIENRHPAVAAAPAEVFRLILLNAVISSGSHSPAEINAAIHELRLRYANVSG